MWSLSANDGETQWTYDVGVVQRTSPAVTDTHIYIGGADGVVNGLRHGGTSTPAEFSPSVHGFGFNNYDTPDILGWEELYPVVADAFMAELESRDALPDALSTAALAGLTYTAQEGGLTKGHCLGMVFTALEYYRTSVPSFPEYDRSVETAADIGIPEDVTPPARFDPLNPEETPALDPVERDIDNAQQTQIFDSTYTLRYVAAAQGPDTGVGSIDHEEVLAAIRDRLDDGRPAPVALPDTITTGHQVLAYDMDGDPGDPVVNVRIYDPNYAADYYTDAELEITFSRSVGADNYQVSYEGRSPTGEPGIEYSRAIFIDEKPTPDYEFFSGSTSRDGYAAALSEGLGSYVSVGVTALSGDLSEAGAGDDGTVSTADVDTTQTDPGTVRADLIGPDGTRTTTLDVPTDALRATAGQDALAVRFDAPPGEYIIEVTSDTAGEYEVTAEGTAADGGSLDDSVTTTVSPDEPASVAATVPTTPGEEGTVASDSDPSPPQIDGVAISLTPTDATVGVRRTTTLAVEVVGATDGVDAFNLDVETSDSDALTLTGASASGSPTVDASGVTADGTTATLRAAGAEPGGGDSVTIGELTVAGEATGSASLSLSVNNLVDQSGDPYAIAEATGANVSVTDAGGPVVVDDRPATDPDGDGVYEDVDGSGSFNIADVSQYLQRLEDPTVQSNPDAFDFDASGSVNIADVTALLRQL
jgi:hypothetical protein